MTLAAILLLLDPATDCFGVLRADGVLVAGFSTVRGARMVAIPVASVVEADYSGLHL